MGVGLLTLRYTRVGEMGPRVGIQLEALWAWVPAGLLRGSRGGWEGGGCDFKGPPGLLFPPPSPQR